MDKKKQSKQDSFNTDTEELIDLTDTVQEEIIDLTMPDLDAKSDDDDDILDLTEPAEEDEEFIDLTETPTVPLSDESVDLPDMDGDDDVLDLNEPAYNDDDVLDLTEPTEEDEEFIDLTETPTVPLSDEPVDLSEIDDDDDVVDLTESGDDVFDLTDPSYDDDDVVDMAEPAEEDEEFIDLSETANDPFREDTLDTTEVDDQSEDDILDLSEQPTQMFGDDTDEFFQEAESTFDFDFANLTDSLVEDSSDSDNLDVKPDEGNEEIIDMSLVLDEDAEKGASLKDRVEMDLYDDQNMEATIALSELTDSEIENQDLETTISLSELTDREIENQDLETTIAFSELSNNELDEGDDLMDLSYTLSEDPAGDVSDIEGDDFLDISEDESEENSEFLDETTDDLSAELDGGQSYDDTIVDSLGLDISTDNLEIPEKKFTIPQEQVDLAVERVINKLYGDKIEDILMEVIGKTVSKDMERIKNVLGGTGQ